MKFSDILRVFYKALRYLLEPIEGDDNKLSGKRMLGSAAVIAGIKIAWYAVKHCIDQLPNITMLITALFGCGLAFWGIAAWQTKSNKSMNNTIDNASTTSADGKSTTDTSTISTNTNDSEK